MRAHNELSIYSTQSYRETPHGAEELTKGTLNLREWTMQEWSEVTKAAYKTTSLANDSFYI